MKEEVEEGKGDMRWREVNNVIGRREENNTRMRERREGRGNGIAMERK